MDKELQEKLFAIEPSFFVRDDARASAMCFGFEIGDGWYWLVETLISYAKRYKDDQDDLKCFLETRDGWLAGRGTGRIKRVVCDGGTEDSFDEEHAGELEWSQPGPYYTEEKRAADIEREGPWFVYYRHECKRPWDHFQVTQVKEKYGSLRFYVNGSNDVYYGMIRMAEELSSCICEKCGKWGAENKADHGWYVTLCEECRASRRDGAGYVPPVS
jgi:hypothetical protein